MSGPVMQAVESAVGEVRKMDGIVDVLGVVSSISRVDDYMILVSRDKKNFYVTVAHAETPGGRRIAQQEAALLRTKHLQQA